jgi:biotin synthesis protein BioG
MKTKFIFPENYESHNTKDLIIFLTGWGCDNVQFKDIKSNRDVLLCWDYENVQFNVNLENYKNIYLIAYSAGVFVAGLIKDKLPKLKMSIAINGNPNLFDKYYGITSEALDIMYNLNLDNYMDFRREFLVFDETELEIFNKHASIRSFESCDFELRQLENFYNQNPDVAFEFDMALISDSDKIFNPKHQIEYFSKKHKILKNLSHNVFSTFTNLDDIIECAK